MKIQYIFLYLLGIYLTNCQRALYQKVILDDKDALCLDGSPGVYFINQGKSPTKFMLHFEGGGWCGDKDLPSTIQNCYQRSLTDLGSSKKYPDNFTVGDGILSTNQLNSFNDFTKVIFKYCDGSGHQGTRYIPIKYKQTQIYFRGNNITIATFDHLQKKYGLFSKSTEILVTGISAGGLAAFTWVDYVRNRSVSKNVYAAPDSGIFLDSPNFNSKQHEYRNMFMNLFKLSNTESNPPNPECVAAHKDQPYLCMLAEHLHWHIKAPLFVIQSLYDSWSLPYILGIRCVNNRSLSECSTQQMAYVQQYHKNTSRVLEQVAASPNNGYWAPVCVNHGYTWVMLYDKNYEIPMNSNNTIDKTLLSWSQRQPGNHRYMDRGNWPENKPCSGISSKLRIQ